MQHGLLIIIPSTFDLRGNLSLFLAIEDLSLQLHIQVHSILLLHISGGAMAKLLLLVLLCLYELPSVKVIVHLLHFLRIDIAILLKLALVAPEVIIHLLLYLLLILNPPIHLIQTIVQAIVIIHYRFILVLLVLHGETQLRSCLLVRRKELNYHEHD